ncbi:TetR family transcriptional regulator [Gordonia pseudamarae]|uniref:TetR family transcriptional regulator n=1 Tax=Gordonia pseudamarae TaxID=2831662 RepID=A0ABX6IFU4_9ACTN|nr:MULTISPECIES: TetR/AcrR family transcriptional regulator [Gordonia]MBD0020340.1 TetR family transcriptional regulator [Gordonia sp. (in: high G+C Gram-positive bacteria)]QHN25794.1 TetR family transcriptional regulator [Gordonia pseudamarae]QHN34725.1 TetR family transcriptional regulator [Gordonia pseudamarae]
MTTSTSGGEDRREVIARSAITVIAGHGVRALTHRAVDREAGIPEGATSHHARTRQALIELIIESLESRTLADTQLFVDSLATSEPRDIDGLASALTELIDALASREADMRARYALMLEPGGDPAAHARLAVSSEIDAVAMHAVSQAMAGAGLNHSAKQVQDLITLADALVFARTVTGTDIASVLTPYLHGLHTQAQPSD